MATTWNDFPLVLAQDADSGRPGAPDNTPSTTTVETTGADGTQTPIDSGNGGGGPPPSPFGGNTLFLILLIYAVS